MLVRSRMALMVKSCLERMVLGKQQEIIWLVCVEQTDGEDVL